MNALIFKKKIQMTIVPFHCVQVDINIVNNNLFPIVFEHLETNHLNVFNGNRMDAFEG